MLRLIIETGTGFKTFDFECEELQMWLKAYHHKLVGIEVLQPPISSSSTLRLLDYPAEQKIPVIKAIRHWTGLGLKEAKEFVEKSAPIELPVPASEKLEGLVKDLREAGAIVG